MMNPIACATFFAIAISYGMSAKCGATSLGELVSHCAPHVAPRTALAIIVVESGGYPWSVNDNDTNYSHRFSTREGAEEYVRARLDADPKASIDVGLAQLNSGNMRSLGLTVGMAFEPCTNIAMSMHILREAYADALSRYGPTRRALFEAFAAYNGGGRVFTTTNNLLRRRVERYAGTVWATAEHLKTFVPRTVRDDF